MNIISHKDYKIARAIYSDFCILEVETLPANRGPNKVEYNQSQINVSTMVRINVRIQI